MPNNQNYKIMVVEDDNTNYLYLSIALETENFRFLRAVDGNEAINLFLNERENFDLILMDIKLPGINGFETTKEIRKHSKDIPIIAQTAFYMPNEQKKFEDFQINDVIFKPFSIEALINIIYKHLKPSKKLHKITGIL